MVIKLALDDIFILLVLLNTPIALIYVSTYILMAPFIYVYRCIYLQKQIERIKLVKCGKFIYYHCVNLCVCAFSFCVTNVNYSSDLFIFRNIFSKKKLYLKAKSSIIDASVGICIRIEFQL